MGDPFEPCEIVAQGTPLARPSARAMAMIAAALLSGCTTQLTTAPDARPAAGQYSKGIPYSLPMLQYSFTATLTLTCSPAREPVIETTVAGKADSIAGERRVIDPAAMSSSVKTSSLDVTFYEETGIVKTINAAIEDHGPEVVAGVLKAGFGIARLAMGIPGAPPLAAPGGPSPLAAESPPEAKPVCSAETIAMIRLRRDAQSAIKQIPDEAQKLQDKLTIFKTRAGLGALTRADKIALQQLLAQIAVLDKKLKILTDQVAVLNKRLQLDTGFAFPNAPNEVSSTYAFDPKAIAGWLSGLVATTKYREGDQEFVDKVAHLALVTDLSARTVDAACTSGKCGKADRAPGFVFRQPVAAIVKVCRSGVPACSSDPAPLFTDDAMAPQLGWLRSLPLVNRFGQNNSLAATFSKSGMLTSVSYAEKSAAAVKGLDAVNGGIDQAQAFAGAVRTKDQAEATASAAEASAKSKAEVDDLQHQIDVATKQAELTNLHAALGDSAAIAGKTQLDTLTAQVALLKLEKEKKELDAAIKALD